MGSGTILQANNHSTLLRAGVPCVGAQQGPSCACRGPPGGQRPHHSSLCRRIQVRPVLHTSSTWYPHSTPPLTHSCINGRTQCLRGCAGMSMPAVQHPATCRIGHLRRDVHREEKICALGSEVINAWFKVRGSAGRTRGVGGGGGGRRLGRRQPAVCPVSLCPPTPALPCCCLCA